MDFERLEKLLLGDDWKDKRRTLAALIGADDSDRQVTITGGTLEPNEKAVLLAEFDAWSAAHEKVCPLL